jgi:hypothetical protein
MTQIRGGLFTRADARACGYPDPDIDSLLDTGGWRRIRPGTYAPHRTFALVTEEMLHLRRIHRVLRYGESGPTASHQSAAALHALPLWGLDLSEVHLTARDGPAGSRGEVHRHVRDPIGPGVQVWNGLRLVSPARAVAEVAATVPVSSSLAPAVVLAEAALYAGLTTSTLLKRAASQLVDGIEQAQRVVAHAGAESASVAESRLRLILAEAGLPAPSSSPPPTIDGELVSCSLWFPDERTVVEFEPRRPFWCEEFDDYLEEVAERAFGAPRRGEPPEPEPVEHCWISWSDLDDATLVVDRVRTAFARASRRTGVRIFDPGRRRRKRSGTPAGRRRQEFILPTDHDLPG